MALIKINTFAAYLSNEPNCGEFWPKMRMLFFLYTIFKTEGCECTSRCYISKLAIISLKKIEKNQYLVMIFDSLLYVNVSFDLQ